MKAIVYLMAGSFLVSFSPKTQTASIDGLWTGVYRSDLSREKVLVKFESRNQVELYNGEVDENRKSTGTYKMQGDSVVTFTYENADGKKCTMQGHINKRRNYVDGVWETSDKKTGSFYLKKEKLEELLIQP